MLIMRKAVLCEDSGYMGTLYFFSPFFCEPETALENKVH